MKRPSSPSAWPAIPDPRDPYARPVSGGAAPVVPPLIVEWRAPLVAPSLLSDDDLVRIATDHDPCAVPTALDLVLGPYGADADHRSQIVATGWGALFTTDAGGDPPLDRWATRGSGRERAGARALLRTPPAPWRIAALDGARAIVEDVVGLGTFAPTGPVTLRPWAAPAGPLRVGGGLLARIVRVADGGWVAVGGIAAPTIPAGVGAWVAAAGRAAVADGAPVLTAVDALCARGYDVARRILETAYLTEHR